jgi:hypothetical protein
MVGEVDRREIADAVKRFLVGVERILRRVIFDREIPRGRGGGGIGFGKSVASSQGLQGRRRGGIISSTRRGGKTCFRRGLCWYQSNSDTRVLTPQTLWHQKVLTPEEC